MSKIERDEPLKINMLGGFFISRGGKILLQDEGRSRKVWNLLAYLIANRHRTLSGNELPELLCSDERSDDPTKAVKNLAYRLRIMLADSDLPKEDYILQKGGTYHWNNDIPIEVDTELFRGFMQKAGRVVDDTAKAKKLYFNAIEEYHGIFLPSFSYEEWVIDSAVKFQRDFLECIEKAHRYSESEEDYKRLLEICEVAITYDVYEEKTYCVYIELLNKLGRQSEALVAYETITNRLYSELGVNPSDELLALHRESLKAVKNIETDLLAIKDGLNEQGQVDGAFCSEYEIFKDVYRFVARGVERTGSSIFIVLCTVTDRKGEIPEQGYLTNGMKKVKDVIGATLRKGDLFAQYSATQYVIMLPNINFENTNMVTDRIETAFKKLSISRHIRINFKLQPLDPQGKN